MRVSTINLCSKLWVESSREMSGLDSGEEFASSVDSEPESESGSESGSESEYEFLPQQYASLIKDLKNEIEARYQPLANEIEKINTTLRKLVSTPSSIGDLKKQIETQSQTLAEEIERINTKLGNLVSTLGKKGFPGEYKDGHGKEPVIYLKESEDGGYIWAKGEMTAGQMGVNPAFHVT